MTEKISKAGGAVAAGNRPDGPASELVADFEISEYFPMASSVVNLSTGSFTATRPGSTVEP